MEQRYTQQAYNDLVRARDEAELRHKKALLALGEAAEADSNTWHDNPAFDAANEAIRHAQNNLRELENRLREAVVIERPTGLRIDVGHVVTLEDSDGEVEQFIVAGSHASYSADANGPMGISTSSPLGVALLGHVPGDSISYVSPTGRQMSFTVVAVE